MLKIIPDTLYKITDIFKYKWNEYNFVNFNYSEYG